MDDPQVGRQLLEGARALGPIIRQHFDEIEAKRRLPPPIARAIVEARLNKLWVPHSMGGFELDPVTYIDLIAEVARLDGAVGWNLMLNSSLAIFAGYLTEESAEEVFGPDDALVAGQFNAAAGRAIAVPGGYRMSGDWAFASGILQSTWVVSGATVYDGDTPRPGPNGEPATLMALTPTSAVEIRDTWHTLGLRGTGSNDYALRDVFVPENKTFQLGGELRQSGILYKLPRAWGFPLSAPAIGIAYGALDAMKEIASRSRSRGSGRPWREDPIIQREVARAQGLVEAGRAGLRQALRDIWETLSAGEAVTPEEDMRLTVSTPQLVYSAAEAVEILFIAGGGSAVYTRNPLERRLRDIWTLRQHMGFGLDRLRRAGEGLLLAEGFQYR